LAGELLARRAEVVGITRDTAGLRLLDVLGIRRRLELAHGSITDFGLVQRVMNDYEIDTVFHLATQSTTTAAERAPASTFESNVLGTWTVLEAAKLSSLVDRVVVASCGGVYGSSAATPFTEESPLLGLRPYDASKVCADVIARSYGARASVHVAVVRLGTVYGPGDVNWSRLVPGCIRSILAGVDPVLSSDCNAERDFLYVTDAVSGCLSAAEHLPGIAGRAFNLGTGRGTSAFRVVEMLLRALGAGAAGLRPRIVGAADHGVDRIVLSPRLAERLLGWSPVMPLLEGLEASIEWYRDYLAEGHHMTLLQKTRA
jgi:CDP-glucose 4,6-dehydratase